MHPRNIIHTYTSVPEEGFMKAVVAERGQVTIPKRLRERLGIRPGTVLEFREEADKLIAEKAETAGALDRWYGSLGRKRRTDDIIRALRGEL
jgi:AbrB family looped-hinge helix DNA binding protein